ncbi:hypothetical protein ACIRL3_40555 [Streptomyces sp. NPDC102384]|uniref:hypothetical protein n=1 Tax=Streptomyces sp. NPDC102384 TaxID=3366166 RepID=UPI00380FC24F
MIRIVTTKRLALLDADTHAAFERARETSEAAHRAAEQHTNELNAATDRAERAESATAEVSELLAHALDELAAVEQDLLRRDIEIRRLRKELEGESLEGQWLTMLLHYGEPHTVYASYEEAKADTATHGVAAGTWVTGDERPPAEVKWRLEAFTYDAACNGFRRVVVPAQRSVGEAA